MDAEQEPQRDGRAGRGGKGRCRGGAAAIAKPPAWGYAASLNNTCEGQTEKMLLLLLRHRFPLACRLEGCGGFGFAASPLAELAQAVSVFRCGPACTQAKTRGISPRPQGSTKIQTKGRPLGVSSAQLTKPRGIWICSQRGAWARAVAAALGACTAREIAVLLSLDPGRISAEVGKRSALRRPWPEDVVILDLSLSYEGAAARMLEVYHQLRNEFLLRKGWKAGFARPGIDEKRRILILRVIQ